MKRFQWTFNGTGADVYLCFGFIPDHLLVIPIGGAVTTGVELEARCEWWKQGTKFAGSSGAAITKGIFSYTGTTYIRNDNKYAAESDGISVYRGGDLLTSALQTSVGFGEGVYLMQDETDYRYGATAGRSAYDSVSELINKWTLDTAANRTGHFNEDVTGGYIGAGSRIIIDAKEYFIQALTAAQGEAADEVTLSEAAASGEVTFIGGKWTMKPVPIGQMTKAGVKLEPATGLNTNNETHLVIATLFDN